VTHHTHQGLAAPKPPLFTVRRSDSMVPRQQAGCVGVREVCGVSLRLGRLCGRRR
jgi:hypothetical protein